MLLCLIKGAVIGLLGEDIACLRRDELFAGSLVWLRILVETRGHWFNHELTVGCIPGSSGARRLFRVQPML